MAILVTGGAGYIGSHTVAELLEHHEDVVIIDNLETGHKEAMFGGTFYKGDIRDASLLKRIFTTHHIDVVIHFAGSSLVGESMSRPLDYYWDNQFATFALVRSMIEHDVKCLVFSSTAAVYGEPVHIPIRETDPILPTNPYGETKRAIERMLFWCEKAYGLKTVSLRYFNAAGAHPNGQMGEDHEPETHLVPLIMRTALGLRASVHIYGGDYRTKDGTCIRDYIHVMDLASAHRKAAYFIREHRKSAVFNLGNGTGYSVMEIVEKAREVTMATIPVVIQSRRVGDPEILIASSTEARQKLGWTPAYSRIEEILNSAWIWHRNYPNGYRTEAIVHE